MTDDRYLLLGITGDDLCWTVVTRELFDTIKKEIEEDWEGIRRGDHPKLYSEGEKFRKGIIEQFFTQAWTTGDTDYQLNNIKEVLTYMAD